MNKLIISNLQVEIEGKPILKGLDLTVGRGEIHAIMGPNGAGKSTLAKVLMGDPAYQVVPATGQKVEMNGQDLLELETNQRAELGLFLSFQNPVEIPGVRVETFLREAYNIRFKDQADKIIKALDFRRHLEALAIELEVNPELLKRGLNENFSGGEKKRLEILQMALLKPEFAILDETDSGLDIDALKAVAKGVNKIVKANKTGVIVITHYQRILEYLKPDRVHVMVGGKIVESGSGSLVKKLEERGYKDWSSRDEKV